MSQKPTVQPNEVEANKALVRRVIEEVFNKGNLDAIDELCAPDFEFHNAPFGILAGAEGGRHFVTSTRAGFPDNQIVIEDLIAEGDKVVARFTARGTHKGAFQGINPTHRRAAAMGIAIWQIKGGKIQQGWGILDVTGVMQQVGVMPGIGTT